MFSVNNNFLKVLPLLEEFQKVYLWLGGDINRWESSRHFSRKLGDKRCFLIRYVFAVHCHIYLLMVSVNNLSTIK